MIREFEHLAIVVHFDPEAVATLAEFSGMELNHDVGGEGHDLILTNGQLIIVSVEEEHHLGHSPVVCRVAQVLDVRCLLTVNVSLHHGQRQAHLF